VHRFTNDQVDFIMMHELGHVALSHPQRLQKERDAGHDVTQLRHEFEFAADAFALGLMRSKLLKHVKAESESPQVGETDSQTNRITESLHDYQGALGSVYILFIFMDFIQQAGELLRDRLSSHLHVRSQMDNHILRPHGRDSALRQWGLHLAARGGKQAKSKAVVAVARKLAVLLHHLWSTQETYVPFYEQAA
jgi:hypothetical protein